MPARSPRKTATLETARIGFVGAGKIAQAIINGLVVYGKIDPKRIYVAAPSTTNTDHLKITHKGLRTTKRNIDIFGRFDCDVIFLCVNPNVIHNLYKMGGTRPTALTTNYIPNMKHQIYVLSLIFGYSIDKIKQCLLNPDNPSRYMITFHRCVISSSVAYGFGNCYLDVEPDSIKFGELVRNLIGLVAKLEYLPENLMDAACVMVGAGICFCYYFINSLSDGALKVGLTRASSIKFTTKVSSAAAQTLLETGKHANEMKDEASTPSGAAIYGLSVLEKGEVASGICGAVEAAFKRSQALAQKGYDA